MRADRKAKREDVKGTYLLRQIQPRTYLNTYPTYHRHIHKSEEIMQQKSSIGHLLFRDGASRGEDEGEKQKSTSALSNHVPSYGYAAEK